MIGQPGGDVQSHNDALSTERYVTPLGEAEAAVLAAFWGRACVELGLTATFPVPTASCFGDTVELADELLGRVLDGPKRATASALAALAADGAPVPQPGGRWIVMDGSMRPRAVLETTEVRIGPLSSVDDSFAWDEGEGDRTLRSWLADHTWFFERILPPLGLTFHPDIEVVFERFRVAYVEP